MKMVAAAIGVLVLVGAMAFWWARPAPDSATLSSEKIPMSTEDAASSDGPGVGLQAFGSPEQEGNRPPAPERTQGEQQGPAPMSLNADAVASLRRAREEGEPRTPPLAEDVPDRITPSEEELADPDLYLEYEASQKQQVLASFLQASEKKAGELRQAIKQAESRGMSEEQLAEGREKLRRLEELRAELLDSHPELSAPAEDSAGQPESSP